MSLTRDEVLALQHRAKSDWVRSMAASSEGAALFERDGLTASIVPTCPARSIPNSVVYADPAALRESLDPLAEAFADAGVETWTVWVPEFDRETASALRQAGHEFDGHPMAMALELERWDPPELGDLDWDGQASGETWAHLNDIAYDPAPTDGLGGAISAPPDYVRLYQARIGGEPACVLGTIDHDADVGFYFVATHPDHRGRGLASRLMAAALADARERGMRTSTLQASAMGEPVYRRLGYQPYFRLELYERRRDAG